MDKQVKNTALIISIIAAVCSVLFLPPLGLGLGIYSKKMVDKPEKYGEQEERDVANVLSIVAITIGAIGTVVIVFAIIAFFSLIGLSLLTLS